MPEFLQHLMELWSDPAHLAFEVTTTMVLALFAQFLTWPVVARRIRREHATIDAEHGVNHDDWLFAQFDADTDDDPDSPIEYYPTSRGDTRG